MIAEFLLSALFTATLLGRYDDALQMSHAEQSVAASFAETQWEALPPDEAVDWFSHKLAMTPEMHAIVTKFLQEEGRLLKDYSSNIFTMAGIERIRLLQVIQDSILNALKEGTTFQDWKKQVDSAFDQAGYGRKDPWHLETVYRTNLFSAYNAGRYRQGMATADLLPYWQYKAVLDSRTRAAHARMNNFIARKDDPIWQIWFPPNGFNCRCTVISLTEDQAATYPRIMPTSVPDTGFDRNPGIQDLSGTDILAGLLKKAASQYEAGWKSVEGV